MYDENKSGDVEYRTARYVWLMLGVAALGAMIGFLTGASNSPVVGTAISSTLGGVFGFVGGLISARKKEE